MQKTPDLNQQVAAASLVKTTNVCLKVMLGFEDMQTDVENFNCIELILSAEKN